VRFEGPRDLRNGGIEHFERAIIQNDLGATRCAAKGLVSLVASEVVENFEEADASGEAKKKFVSSIDLIGERGGYECKISNAV
jgi:hypothetical protein